MEYSETDYIEDVVRFFDSRPVKHTVPLLRAKFINELVQIDSNDYSKLSQVKRKIEALDSLMDEMAHIVNTQSLKERNNERTKSIA